MEGQQHQQQLQVVRPLKIGVLALQGAFLEHINLLARLENPPQTVEVRNPSTLHSFRKDYLAAAGCYLLLLLRLEEAIDEHDIIFFNWQIREKTQLDDPNLDALIIPGGESTTMALVAERDGILEKLREWVGLGKPVWVSIEKSQLKIPNWDPLTFFLYSYIGNLCWHHLLG